LSALLSTLRRRIDSLGPLSVADYMSECLCHPRFGYYMTRDPFGQKGDFITAPEISQTFGELLGLWAAITWQQMGSPAVLHLVELGPGRGTLMKDALRASSMVSGFHDALQVHLVEISPRLIEKQKASLEGSGPKISWHGSFSDIPDGPAIFIANEFFDALPIRQFEKGTKGWAERFIDIEPDGEGLRFVLKSDEAALALMPKSLKGTEKTSDLFEISVLSQTIAHALGERLKEFGGAVLVIDYGYEQPAFGETLQALKKHHFHPVLETPGEADLTAHVDFQTLGNSFSEGGASVYGPMGQGDFLTALGITQRTEKLIANVTLEIQKDLVAAYERLTSPDEMGTLFKVICATHPNHPIPAGFEESSKK
jgi:NADH dehydrogenase [ubiquinone] 1 alpha subcomplex assembly factor 7